jgi:hypothetical protein
MYAVGLYGSLIFVDHASAADIVYFPEEGPVVPAYARFESVSELGFTDQKWFVIPFYRDPLCVPEDFNLLNFFDRPRAWACDDIIPPYIEGFAIRTQPPPAPPEHFYANGLPGMPVWFIDWEELQEVYNANNGVVTIGDLEAIEPRLEGVADFYVEEIQTGVNPISSHRIITYGELNDGRSFIATYSHGSAEDVPKSQTNIFVGK